MDGVGCRLVVANPRETVEDREFEESEEEEERDAAEPLGLSESLKKSLRDEDRRMDGNGLHGVVSDNSGRENGERGGEAEWRREMSCDGAGKGFPAIMRECARREEKLTAWRMPC